MANNNSAVVSLRYRDHHNELFLNAKILDDMLGTCEYYRNLYRLIYSMRYGALKNSPPEYCHEGLVEIVKAFIEESGNRDFKSYSRWREELPGTVRERIPDVNWMTNYFGSWKNVVSRSWYASPFGGSEIYSGKIIKYSLIIQWISSLPQYLDSQEFINWCASNKNEYHLVAVDIVESMDGWGWLEGLQISVCILLGVATYGVSLHEASIIRKHADVPYVLNGRVLNLKTIYPGEYKEQFPHLVPFACEKLEDDEWVFEMPAGISVSMSEEKPGVRVRWGWSASNTNGWTQYDKFTDLRLPGSPDWRLGVVSWVCRDILEEGKKRLQEGEDLTQIYILLDSKNKNIILGKLLSLIEYCADEFYYDIDELNSWDLPDTEEEVKPWQKRIFNYMDINTGELFDASGWCVKIKNEPYLGSYHRIVEKYFNVHTRNVYSGKCGVGYRVRKPLKSAAALRWVIQKGDVNGVGRFSLAPVSLYEGLEDAGGYYAIDGESWLINRI